MRTDRKTNNGANRLCVLVMLFVLLGFGLLSFYNGTFSLDTMLFGVAVVILLVLPYMILAAFCRLFDRLLQVIVMLLVGLGLILQYRINPDYAFNQALLYIGGVACMLIAMGFIHAYSKLRKGTIVYMIFGVVLLGVLLFIGDENGGAKNWISFGSIGFQPSEFVKIIVAFALAHYLSDRTRIGKLWVVILFIATVVMLLVAERDLGAAMLIALTTLIVYYAATGNIVNTAIGLFSGAGAAVACYFLFDHVKRRVEIWLDPWAAYEKSGYQIVQGLIAIASGGMFGMGLGLGSPKSIPAYHTDYIFAVICEEFGITFAVILVALYVLFVVRGIMIALKASSRFLALLALGCTTLLTLQSLIIIGGVIKLIPLTGITLPFVSYGGSSLIACLIMVGILQGISNISGRVKL